MSLGRAEILYTVHWQLDKELDRWNQAGYDFDMLDVASPREAAHGEAIDIQIRVRMKPPPSASAGEVA